MSTYDEIAEWYDHWVGTHSMREDPFFPAVEAFIGEVAGQRVCDLACGQGRVARYLADLGARVVGVDLEAVLLAIARRHEETEPRGIEYLQAVARSLAGEALGLFDGVVCCMALMDIPDLAPTLHSVARMLSRLAARGDGDCRGSGTDHSQILCGGLLALRHPTGASWQSRRVPKE
jgi:2-polyprenyl-3-methyl-5-hydroxy-6-metoxy-1,4-benzoquinol methylase